MAGERLRRILGSVTGDSRSPDEIRDAVYLTGDDASAKRSRFWLLLVLATGIATAGVVGDSTATVIGAMIIAPLAIPIQGVAVAIAFGESRALVNSVVTTVLAVAVGVGVAAALAWALPELQPVGDNSQVTGRISPTLVDLVVAALTGLAGSLAVARRDISDILPGVAIAISLVPPLAVVGVTMVAGDWGGALGALLLFLTNVLAIIVAGVLVFSALGFAGRRHRLLRPAYRVVVVAGLVVVAALAFMTMRAVRLSDWQSAARVVAADWAERNGERLVTARFEADALVVLVQGRSDGSQDRELPRLLEGKLPDGTPVTVDRVVGSSRSVGEVGDEGR